MGDAAFYYDPFDVDDIRDVIERVLLSPDELKAMSARATERAASRSWNDVARDIAGVYREVI
jgi:glycosyltransferase involved in cell wall biosynthesis